MLALGLLAGRIADLVGSARAVLAGSIVTVAAFVVLVLQHDRGWQILLVTGLLGTGIGLTYAAIPNVIVDAVAPEQTGVATGVNTNVRTIGGALGGQVTAAVLSSATVAGDHAGGPTERGSSSSSPCWLPSPPPRSWSRPRASDARRRH